MDLLYIKELLFFLFPACNWGRKKKKKRLKSSKQRMGLIQMSKISMELRTHR